MNCGQWGRATARAAGWASSTLPSAASTPITPTPATAAGSPSERSSPPDDPPAWNTVVAGADELDAADGDGEPVGVGVVAA